MFFLLEIIFQPLQKNPGTSNTLLQKGEKHFSFSYIIHVNYNYFYSTALNYSIMKI